MAVVVAVVLVAMMPPQASRFAAYLDHRRHVRTKPSVPRCGPLHPSQDNVARLGTCPRSGARSAEIAA